MARYFYCFFLAPEAFALCPAVFSDQGSTDAWRSRRRFPSCCRVGQPHRPFLGGKQGHDLPWLQSWEKPAGPHHPRKASGSSGRLQGCVLPHCRGTERSSCPQLSAKKTPGSAQLLGHPEGWRQCFDDVERKGGRLSTRVYLPTSQWSCEDYHIAMQSARCKLEDLQK